MIEVIPAVIPESLADMRAKLSRLQGLAPLIQIDITDGAFVLSKSWPTRTSDKKSFEALVRGKEKLPFADEFQFEIDVMAHSPEKYFADWIHIGITRAVFHLKSKHDLSEIKRVLGGSTELGVAIDLETPHERLARYIPDVDYVQVMGIATLGKQGEPFDPRATTLVHNVRRNFPDVTIQVDGGVSDTSAPLLVKAGATRLVSGSYILKSSDPEKAIAALAHHENAFE